VAGTFSAKVATAVRAETRPVGIVLVTNYTGMTGRKGIVVGGQLRQYVTGTIMIRTDHFCNTEIMDIRSYYRLCKFIWRRAGRPEFDSRRENVIFVLLGVRICSETT
jgi:hypothetical protein